MRKLLHISLVAAALIASLGAQAQTTVTDELTQSLFPTVTGNVYADVTDVKATSPAVYSANLATNYEYALFNAVYSGNAQLKPVLIEGGQATGIGSVSASEGAKADTYYTVQGVRMQQGATLPAGIYVKNGKKVVVR